MSYEIKLLELPDQPTLVMRSIMPVGKLPEFFGKAYGGIMAYLGDLGEYPTGMPFCAYYNLDMNALDVEAGFPVAKKFEGKGEIKPNVIPGGKFISTIHIGAYDSVQPAYDSLVQWAKDNGIEPTGIAYEYYLNDPSSDPSIKPETEIRFPLK
ncbi:MAG: GyrI-like domain-containing protein [candidate division Zixibacteria bacterium]|nr:GyrI-like domain-containing protein [candidate division Zixibacteria bacterium]